MMLMSFYFYNRDCLFSAVRKVASCVFGQPRLTKRTRTNSSLALFIVRFITIMFLYNKCMRLERDHDYILLKQCFIIYTLPPDINI